MITAVVGGQYGSEGKGMIVGEVAKDYGVHVRVGASNAGHTAYVDGEKHVVQAIPVAAYANPSATLVIGAGALISAEILEAEVKTNRHYRSQNGLPDLRLLIDYRAHVITNDHIERERATDLAARIGSTSTIAREGIGAATAARVMRESGCQQAGDVDFSYAEVTDTVAALDAYRRSGMDILLEGTQGTGLSLTTGQFPYVTSRNPTAAGLAADAGVGPRHLDKVIMVCRTFPIRVAGNSGPFGPGSEEITFEDLGVGEEKTTVTQLTRRIATFSLPQVQEAVNINSADEIALTFADYVAPSLAGRTTFTEADYENDRSGVGRLVQMIAAINETTDAKVTFVGTGPDSSIKVRRFDLGRLAILTEQVAKDKQDQQTVKS